MESWGQWLAVCLHRQGVTGLQLCSSGCQVVHSSVFASANKSSLDDIDWSLLLSPAPYISFTSTIVSRL